jgi:hypothetical protein
MPKRFIDSEIFKSPSVRALKAPYKMLWLYLINDCDHAGIWIVDFDIASLYLGHKYDANETLKALGDKVVICDGGKRWYLPDFVDFQYGDLNPENRAHKSVLDKLERFGLLENKPLTSPLEGCKDKDKDKDMDKDIPREKPKRKAFNPPSVEEVAAYAAEKGYRPFDAEHFVDFYEAKGWMVGKNKMKDWKAAVRNAKGWESHAKANGRNSTTGENRHGRYEDAW